MTDAEMRTFIARELGLGRSVTVTKGKRADGSPRMFTVHPGGLLAIAERAKKLTREKSKKPGA